MLLRIVLLAVMLLVATEKSWVEAQSINNPVYRDISSSELILPKLKISAHTLKWKYQQGEPILLKITVLNNADDNDVFNFLLQENPFFHFSLKVLNQTEDSLPDTTLYSIWKLTIDKNLGRQRRMELNKGESFSMTIDISKWVTVENTGKYFVEGIFMPNPLVNRDLFSYQIAPISFNVTSVKQSSSSSSSSQQAGAYTSSTTHNNNNNPQQNKLSPYNVVKQHLLAQQKREWKKYLSYIDLTEYIENSYSLTELYERYRSSKSNQRTLILKEFETYLIKSVDYLIETFEIRETYIQKEEEASVQVYVESKSKSEDFRRVFDPTTGEIKDSWTLSKYYNFPEKSFFNFVLKKDVQGWKIVQKEINLGKAKEYVVKSTNTNNNQTGRFKTFSVDKQSITTKAFPIISNLLFALNSYSLAKISFTLLDKVIALLAKEPNYNITLTGHTDSEGTASANISLSFRRAREARDYLISQGIDTKRLIVKGLGETQLLYPQEESEEVRRKNRRVEIKFIEN